MYQRILRLASCAQQRDWGAHCGGERVVASSVSVALKQDDRLVSVVVAVVFNEIIDVLRYNTEVGGACEVGGDGHGLWER